MAKTEPSLGQADYWWQCDSTMPGHFKVRRLATMLGCDRYKAFGHICALFCNVRRYAPNGDLSHVDEGVLADWSGNKKITRETLVACGWLDPDLAVHEWAERYAKMEERRVKATERMRLLRAQNVRTTCAERDANVTRDGLCERSHHVRHKEGEGEGYTLPSEGGAGAPFALSADSGKPAKNAPDPIAMACREFVAGWFDDYQAAYSEKPLRPKAAALTLLKQRVQEIGLAQLEALRRVYFGLCKAGDRFFDSPTIQHFLSDASLEKCRGQRRAPVKPVRPALDLLDREREAVLSEEEYVDQIAAAITRLAPDGTSVSVNGGTAVTVHSHDGRVNCAAAGCARNLAWSVKHSGGGPASVAEFVRVEVAR